MSQYKIEFHHKEEVVASFNGDYCSFNPSIGDTIKIELKNAADNINYWVITGRKLFFTASQQTLMLNIVPDINEGAWREHPLYKVN